tara:strand:+ start:982 stop:1995 length:1014 start_codon:yes stop_codon:yes gene_type:complete
MLTHEIVGAHAIAACAEMKLHGDDVWAHVAPMFHLVDAFAIYSMTLVGGRHVIVPTFEAGAVIRLIEREGITVTNVASTMIAIMCHNPLLKTHDLSTLRVVSCGGCPLAPAAVTRAIAIFGCEFFISYGMTECCGKISMSILSDSFRHDNDVQTQLKTICTSGRPFALMDVKVLNPKTRFPVVNAGEEIGEVWVRGSTSFHGYWNRDRRDDDSFDEHGWFNTGDLAVVREDGYITLVDRAKDMILCGGENGTARFFFFHFIFSVPSADRTLTVPASLRRRPQCTPRRSRARCTRTRPSRRRRSSARRTRSWVKSSTRSSRCDLRRGSPAATATATAT